MSLSAHPIDPALRRMPAGEHHNCNLCSKPEYNCGCPWLGHLDDCPHGPKLVDTCELPKWLTWLARKIPGIGLGMAIGDQLWMEKQKKKRDRALAELKRKNETPG